VPSATGGFVPSIDTREVITQVLVNNGETVVLGGIHETEQRETYTKVPFLGDIPGLGKLFSSTQKENNKAELLIFVTPRILKEGSNVY
jgi:type IV pilus assembly protein PilQ